MAPGLHCRNPFGTRAFHRGNTKCCRDPAPCQRQAHSFMIGRLLAVFLLTPVIELALLIRLGAWIGFWPTIAIIVVTGVTGTFLARNEGLSVWKRFNERLGSGDLPGRELLDGVIILVAGALLITPGVLTDVVGFIGLIPATRSLIRTYLTKRLRHMVARGTVHTSFQRFDFKEPSGSSSRPTSTRGDGGNTEEWKGEARETPTHRRSDGS